MARGEQVKSALRLERAVATLSAKYCGQGYWEFQVPNGETGEARTAELVGLGKLLAESDDTLETVRRWLSE